MKFKNKKGFVGTDMVIAILAIMIFSGIIFSLIYSNVVQHSKIKAQALAMIYLTETMENIGIAQYSEITQENTEEFIPNDLPNNYNIDLSIEPIEGVADSTNIIKKVTATISYKSGNRDYKYSLERMKAKE